MLIDFLKENDLLNEDELIFFGGSFNPWHAGHGSCVKLMPKDKKIIVIPDHSPFKEITDNSKKNSSIDDIQKHLNEFDHQTFIFDEFFYANKKNPTYSWIKPLKTSFPEKKISLLMGFDSFITIDRWTNAHELLNTLSTIYIASRMDDEFIKEEQRMTLKSINPSLEVIFLGGHPYESLSSTKLRKNQSHGP